MSFQDTFFKPHMGRQDKKHISYYIKCAMKYKNIYCAYVTKTQILYAQ